MPKLGTMDRLADSGCALGDNGLLAGANMLLAVPRRCTSEAPVGNSPEPGASMARGEAAEAGVPAAVVGRGVEAPSWLKPEGPALAGATGVVGVATPCADCGGGRGVCAAMPPAPGRAMR
mmetsp:Transcript_67142/g.216592  ORF Transcript_67142/g.216592 Transcript_67142/m.216592 type:complete len:120 (+) Transcript_67142:179-538(+)